MSAAGRAELERVTSFAKSIVAPLAEVWSRSVGSTVLIGSPQAEEARATELAGGLDGWYWVLPVEITGIYGGAMALLVDQKLVVERGATAGPSDEGTQKRFAAILDEFLAGAGERLGAAVAGPVMLDRLGLREVPGEQAAQVLAEFLGRDELVVVSFTAEMAASRSAGASRTGEVAVVVGTNLARDLGAVKTAHSNGAPVTNGVPAHSAAPRRARDGAPNSSKDAEAAASTAKAGTAAARRAGPSEAGLPASLEAAAPAFGPSRGIGSAAGGQETEDVSCAESDVSALLDRARGLRLTVSAEIGRKVMTLGELARMGPGSVIDLDRSVTEPLELLVGGKSIATGDAVTVRDGFGFRVRSQRP